MKLITHLLRARRVGASPLRLATTAAALMVLTACASAPLVAPDLALQSAAQAIGTAEQARAERSAAAELSEARDKLAAAHNAVQQNDMQRAAWLAQEARVDAELALAKADAIEARAINEQMRQSTETMKHEMQRSSGGGE